MRAPSPSRASTLPSGPSRSRSGASPGPAAAGRWRVRILARLQAPWLDLALASGADSAGRRSSNAAPRTSSVVPESGAGRRCAAPESSARHGARPGRPTRAGGAGARCAERQLVELEELRLGRPVYGRGVARACDGSPPRARTALAQRRRDLRERVAEALAALRGRLTGNYKIFLGHGGGGRQDLPDAAGGPRRSGRRARRRDRLPGAARTAGDQRAGARPGGAAAARGRDPRRRDGRGDGPAGAAARARRSWR